MDIAVKGKKSNNKHAINEQISAVNIRIKNEICRDTLALLTDDKLMPKYKECKSVKNEIIKLCGILDKYVNEETKQQIIADYLLQLIPAGTKGVIRGNAFNDIVKKRITDMMIDPQLFDISFEKKCELCLTDEIPDWYIHEHKTNKIIIGMNQLDLWGGGQQVNRGSKYLIDNKHNTALSKLLCVVCNEIQFTKRNKILNLFEIGFRENTLCYLGNLENIIRQYFIATD